MTFEPTPEQRKVLAHPIDRHGRLLAGPGTGKSETILRLARGLKAAHGASAVHIITFTRAATAELTLKAAAGGSSDMVPTTLHAFCLSTLMRHSDLTDLPLPLRIPDDWETKNLIRPDIARRLRERGFKKTRVGVVRVLEAEMSARWESLDPEYEALADVDPGLRNAYLSVWNGHRSTFGYSLFAEMPLKTGDLVKDHDSIGFDDLTLLVVDEYQDLNRSEIDLLEALGNHGVFVLAVGDDDQSIYGFRMADPAGIREFSSYFTDAADYQLSKSMRCGTAILEAASTLIETAPKRASKKRLVPLGSNPDGRFAYLAFDTHVQERKGVLALIEHMLWEGLKPSDIVVMMRGDYNQQWSKPLRELLEASDIEAVDVEAALGPLREDATRRALAIARLVATRHDDLAWWALLQGTSGVSPDFINGLADEALTNLERFWQRLSRIAEEPVEGGTSRSWNATKELVRFTEAFLTKIDIEAVPASENGWADFLFEIGENFGIELSEEFRELAIAVGVITPFSEGLAHFLNQLEPIAKDIALLTDGVAIMSMQRSKGLTFRGAIIMGVENGVIPSPRSRDVEEERRLLYVAMTRAKEYVYLTMATRRTGPTARTGDSNVGQSRGRCHFFSATDIGPTNGRAYLKTLE